MTASNPLLFDVPARYEQPQLKSLPLREQPAYRVIQDATACNLTNCWQQLSVDRDKLKSRKPCWHASMEIYAACI